MIQRRNLIKEKLDFWNCCVSDSEFALKVSCDWQRVEINDNKGQNVLIDASCNFLIHLFSILYLELNIMNSFTQNPTIKSPHHTSYLCC